MPERHPGKFLDKSGNYEVRECVSCGFRHLYPLPDNQALKEFYEADYYQRHKPEYIDQDSRDARYLEIAYDERLTVLSHLTSGRRILDVGCGSGMFLEYASRKAWDCTGIEPSEMAAAEAMRRGLNVFPGTLEGFIGQSRGLYDVVYLKNVLEHVREPEKTLSSCRGLLRGGGVLFVEVPNDYEFMQRFGVWLLRERKSWITVPDHINYFDFASLRRLLLRTGMVPVQRSTSFPIYGLLMFGQNFISDRSVGKRAHHLRMDFEFFWDGVRLRCVKNAIYGLLAFLGTGRTVIYYCKAGKERG